MAVNRIKGAFAVPRKGETFELRAGLVSQYAYERKEAIQKTIMSMTLGKDVSALFPDVLKNIATPDLDQKKLVYLYLMNYAKSHPDLCILAVNTFVQDSEDPNPLVRALAIRTMGCIRVDKMVDYMEEPLRKTLRDESPYVRKTAVLCVAKLFDLNPTMCLEDGFLETLQELVGDPNPMVVANAVQALSEINEAAPETKALVITPTTLKKMLLALNECTEWGRVTILTTLADYKAADVKEAEHICERVSPQFQHVNPSVVLAAVKVVFLHMKYVGPELAKSYLRKMAPPLVTLISSAPEVQYVALRNIDLLLQKQPDILSKEIRVFFCKYNDPPYLKLQKLEVMVRVANDKNVDQLLAELKEYATEVDMDFARRAVKAIGQVAIKIESASEKCVNTLLDLIATKVNYVVQEAIVVIKDIFRRYPGYEGIIPTLCQCIDELDEPNARGALIWIVGEYAEKISNAGEILAGFVDGFAEEFTQTQLQILTAVVKLFLKKPDQSQGLVQKVLQAATADNDNPDIRDRAYVYWRLLSSDPQIAKNIVLSDKPPITSTIPSLPPALLDQLITELSTLASVYHKPPESFLGQGRFGAEAMQKAAIDEQQENARENPIAARAAAAAVSGGTAAPESNIENLLDIDFDGAAPASMQKQPPSGTSGLEGLAGTPQRVASPSANAPTASSNMDSLIGVFGDSAASAPNAFNDDLMNGFASLSMSDNSQPPPPTEQLPNHGNAKKTNEDLLVSKFLFGDTSKESIIEVPQGQLYLVRPLSVKGYSELIFKDAAASIRRTGQDFQYQLVIQRAYEEGEEELLAEEEGEDSVADGLSGEKDEKIFLLDESIQFRTDTRQTGEKVFAWKDLSGDVGDLWEFVCDRSVPPGTAASFELVALQCQYERKYRKSFNQATEQDLQEFSFIEEPIPDASPISSPRSKSPTALSSPAASQLLTDASPDFSPAAMVRRTEEKGKAPETPTKALQTPNKKTIAPLSAVHPEGREVLADEVAELHLFDFESGAFVLEDPAVHATVSDIGNWDYWLQITGKKRDWLGQRVVPELNPVFNFEYLSFIFNHYTEDGSAYSWLLRFKDQATEERFQEGLMQALWEHLNETKWIKAKEADREYVLDAFQDLTLEDAPDEEEEDRSDTETDEETDEDGRRSEHYDSDESEDDVETREKDGHVNSQLAVGFKNDRSFVVRGSKIGVFKHTDDNQLEFTTNISKVQTPKGKLFSPEKVMLHAEDRNMILQNADNPNSLYRMDLEYGKVVDEWKVDDNIPVNVIAPESKFAQMTGEQTFLGLSHNALFRIDPRLAGNKLVDTELKQYASKNDFSAAATTEKGYIAVSSNKGDIRMFDRLGINAKTHIPALGDPIIGLDVSADGRWILATTRTYLLLVDALQKDGKNEGKLGFEKSFAKDSKPQPRRLALSPSHVAQLQHETKAPLSFTTARFNTGIDSTETTIVTATGPFIVTWSMKKILAGRKDPYLIKRYAEEVKADNFRYGSDKNLIVALPNEVDMVARKALRRPTRESIATPSRVGGARKSGARGSYLSRNDIVNSPY